MIPVYKSWIRPQQDTTRQSVMQDTLHMANANSSIRDTVKKEQKKNFSINDIEKILQQSEQRLEKIDSVITRQPVSKPQYVIKKALQQPVSYFDSTHIIVQIQTLPDNSGKTLINRLDKKDLSTLNKPGVVFKPVEKKPLPLKTTTEKPVSFPVAVERKPAYLREDWFLIVLVTSFMLITWTKIRFGKFLNQTLVSLWNFKAATSLFRNKSSFYKRTSFYLLINYLLSGSLFIYLFLEQFNLSLFPGTQSDILNYLIIALFLLGLYIYLILVIRITGFLSMKQESFREYSHFTTLFFHNAGFYLFPINAIIPYIYEGTVTWFIYTGFILLSVFYLLRIIRLTVIFFEKRFSIFYLFLYLCALEILPFLICIHLIFR